jgi:hypothetical protein
MEVFGYIEEGSMEIVGSRVGGYRGVVMNKFADLISKYDHQLCVEMRETVSETGKTINEVGKDEATGILPREPDCFCNDEASKDQVHTLGCCGKKVHVNCLVAYIHTIPFCMFCSTSLFQSLESLPEEAVMLPTMSQSSTLSKDNNGVDDGDVMMKDGDDKPPAEIPLCQVIPNGSVGDEAGGDVCDGGDGGDGRDTNMTMEDIVRKEAREKKARMQIGGALVLFFARERRSVWLFVFLVQPSHTFFNPYQILPAISEEHHRAPPIAHQRRHCQLRHNADPPPGSTLRTAWKVFVRLSKIGPCYRMRASFARAIALSDF